MKLFILLKAVTIQTFKTESTLKFGMFYSCNEFIILCDKIKKIAKLNYDPVEAKFCSFL